MGNSCIQREKQQNNDSLQVSVEIQNKQPITLEQSLTFKEVLLLNSSRYVFQEGDTVRLYRPLSPRAQHQIQYLEPKYLEDEGNFTYSEHRTGILSQRSTQQEQSSNNSTPNPKDKTRRKVNFKI